MNDCFALLKEPRRPWLDTESLKAKFFLLSAAFHPDKVHGGTQDEKSAAQQRYSELNSAYNRLRDPKERLLHLLELERGEKPKDTQRIAPSLAETFNQVNLICRAADALRSEAHRITSPLLKVAMFDRAQETTEKLRQLQQEIHVQREAVLTEIQQIDSAWTENSDRQIALGRLEELYRLLSYFTRWSGQLQDRVLQLAF